MLHLRRTWREDGKSSCKCGEQGGWTEYRWTKQIDLLAAAEFHSDYFMQSCLTFFSCCCVWTLSALLTQGSASDLRRARARVYASVMRIKDDENRRCERTVRWRPCVWQPAAPDNGPTNLQGSRWPTESSPPPGKHSPSPREEGSKSGLLHTRSTFMREMDGKTGKKGEIFIDFKFRTLYFLFQN